MTATNHSTHPVTGKPWHVPSFRPHCWTDPDAPNKAPEELGPRAGWSWDAGAACGDARSEWHRERQALHTPGCVGCSRRFRAIMIEQGKVQPHPSVKTGPMRDGVKVAA